MSLPIERRFKGWPNGAQRTTWASTSDELIIDYRTHTHTHTTTHRVSSFKFLGIHISENVSWTTNTNKHQQTQTNTNKHHSDRKESTAAVLLSLTTTPSRKANRKWLQRTLKTAQNIINQQLPTMDAIFNSRCLQKTHNILKDSFHPANYLFEHLPSGKRYRSIRIRTTRFMNS